MDKSDDIILGGNPATIAHPPPGAPWAHLILRDETGQPWAISVRPDGQLQTAKWPDGEPITFARELSEGQIARSFRTALVRVFEEINEPASIESLQAIATYARHILDNPNSSETAKRVAGTNLDRVTQGIEKRQVSD